MNLKSQVINNYNKGNYYEQTNSNKRSKPRSTRLSYF